MRRVAIPFLMLVAFGCHRDAEPAPGPAPEPMATTGPDQVVIFVPTMVCESCPEKVAEGLGLLAWVDADSIHSDRKLRQVRFRVKDRVAFDPEAVKETISRKGFKGVLILTGPT